VHAETGFYLRDRKTFHKTKRWWDHWAGKCGITHADFTHVSICEPADPESSYTTGRWMMLAGHTVSPLVLQPATQKSCMQKEN